MIRRQIAGRYILVAQHEHALLSGRLASHCGNAWFERPDPAEQVIDAIAMHDCGWQEHDAAPSLNQHGLPGDVFETPLADALHAWEQAGELLADAPPYVRLLVSLHVMGLSAFAAAAASRTRRDDFELNRFQHSEVERQELLRNTLGMRVDVPLKLGLAVGCEFAEEERLRNHTILQAMDRLSLAVCCQTVPFGQIDGVVPRESARPLTLHFERTGDWAVRVDPWPFDGGQVRLPLVARDIPVQPYAQTEFATALATAEPIEIEVGIHP